MNIKAKAPEATAAELQPGAIAAVGGVRILTLRSVRIAIPSGSGLNLPASAVLLAHPASVGVQTGCGRVNWTHSNVHEVGEGVRDATSSRIHVRRADSSHLEREPSTDQGQSGLDLPTCAGVPSDPGDEFTHNLREVGGGTHGD